MDWRGARDELFSLKDALSDPWWDDVWAQKDRFRSLRASMPPRRWPDVEALTGGTILADASLLTT